MKAIGRRKQAVAKVKLTKKKSTQTGAGLISINNINALDYLVSNIETVSNIQGPVELLGLEEDYNIDIKVKGGGLSGQAQAIRLAIARAFLLSTSQEGQELEIQETNQSQYNKVTLLKSQGYLTQDARCKERKKYSLKKARKAPQFSKR